MLQVMHARTAEAQRSPGREPDQIGQLYYFITNGPERTVVKGSVLSHNIEGIPAGLRFRR